MIGTSPCCSSSRSSLFVYTLYKFSLSEIIQYIIDSGKYTVCEGDVGMAVKSARDGFGDEEAIISDALLARSPAILKEFLGNTPGDSSSVDKSENESTELVSNTPDDSSSVNKSAKRVSDTPDDSSSAQPRKLQRTFSVPPF